MRNNRAPLTSLRACIIDTVYLLSASVKCPGIYFPQDTQKMFHTTLQTIRPAVFLLLIGLFSSTIFAQTDTIPPDLDIQPQVIKQMRILINDIAQTKQSIRALDQQLQSATLESDIERLREERQREQEKFDNRLNSIEQTATGAVDLSRSPCRHRKLCN